MKVLVAHGDAAERRRLAHVIATAGHVVIEAETRSAVSSSLDREPEIVVVDWRLGGAALVRYLRGLDDSHRYYVIVACKRPQPHDIAELFAAGADDFISATTSKEELLARIDGLTRVRKWAAVLRPAEKERTHGFDMDNLRFWRELPAIVGAELGEMLGTPLDPEPSSAATIRWAGTIPLSLSSEHVEVRFSVGLELGASDLFAKEVLGGDTTREALSDALREIANVAGGAIQRAALRDGVTITIGLPSNENLFTAPNARTWSVATPSGLRVALGAVALASQGRPVSPVELREGMVVANDVCTVAGMLLVSAGTYLTATTVDRLSVLLDANMRVDVTETVALLHPN